MSNVFDTFASYGVIADDSIGEYTALYTVQRQIGGIFPTIVTREIHNDTLAITEQPVEVGAPVTDHAWMQPFRVDIEGGFSDSDPGAAAGWVQAAYGQLQALQQGKQPFSISTGKRYYTNMLIERISVITDPESEYALDFRASCKQIIIVSTQGSAAAQPMTNGSTNPEQTNPDLSSNSGPSSASFLANPNLDLTSPNAPVSGGTVILNPVAGPQAPSFLLGTGS